MKRHFYTLLILLLFMAAYVGCPHQPVQYDPLCSEREILEQLISRRDAMNPMEADVKFMFPEGMFLTSSLEGHGAYMRDSETTRLRIAAVGPLGAISMDLLVERGDFLVRLPGYTELLNQRDLSVIYGDSALIRTPSILAHRPGLFFGGLPEGVDESWTFEVDEEGKWLVPPDEKGTKYLMKDNPAIVHKAMLYEEGIGELVVEMSRWMETEAGPVPTRITTKFEERTLFSMKVRNCQFGSELPDSVFILKGGKRSSEL